jgi:hypothetical protein
MLCSKEQSRNPPQPSKAVVLEFFQFCQVEKLEFPNFSDATVLEFVAVSFANG